jgi:serine/threonine-protein kinase
MTDSTHQREQEIFHECLELSPDELAAYLQQLGRADGQLQRRVERLLRAHRQAENATFEPFPFLPLAACPSPGGIAGPWRLVRKIGEGGMASVWLAERLDGRPDHPVAIKLAHTGWSQNVLAERMERERVMLATLDHPNIARLLDAGFNSNGQPYLVLEYVEGQHIDEYCSAGRLPLAPRLDLFLQVTSAITYAHNRLIVHRDLKPSNILVTENGAARVLDFGIAKLLQSGQTQETALTHLAGPALTLDYASPEQLLGKPLTVGSDVYSLGVVLYELLTGTRPHQLKGSSRAILEEAILRDDPRKPSDVVADKSLRRKLCGDLDTIVLKALKKNLTARYVSVDSLAEDLRRYLQNRPVLAQPDSRSYRFAKFMRRHRVAALISVILCASSLLVAWQSSVAFAQKQRAEAVKSFVIAILLEAHSYWGDGKPLSAVGLLKQIQARVDSSSIPDARTRIEVLNIVGASLLSQQDTLGAETVISRAVHETRILPRNDAMALRARLLRNWIRLFRGQVIQVRIDIDRLLSDMKGSAATFPEDLAGAYRIRSAVCARIGRCQSGRFVCQVRPSNSRVPAWSARQSIRASARGPLLCPSVDPNGCAG